VQTAPTQAGVTFTHSYDANNRRVGQAASDNSWLLYPATTGTTSYTANNLNQYTALGGASPTYDNNGNLTFDGTVTYCYDVEGRLTRAITAGTCASPATTLGAYAFDAQGRRKSKTAGGTTTITVTDADNREVLEYDGSSGAIQRWYAYGAGTNDVLGQMNVAAATRTTLVPDIQGSFIASMASNATTFSKANFLPYGENSASTSGTFRYTGSRIDPETVATSQPSGIYYMRARAYSPQWGRFIQVDPIGYQGGINLYAYTGNDPVNQTDPMGLQACAAVGSGPGSTCLESNNSVYSNTNIGPVQGENQGVLQNIHSIDTANPPESSYAVHNDPSSGNGFSLVKVGGAETNTSNTTGLRLTPSDYIGSVGEAHPHPYNDYSPDVGPEDPVASYKLGVPVYTSAPGTVTVTGMVNGQFYTQYLQGRAQERSDVQRILNRAQSLVNSGTISAGGPGVSASYGPGK